MEKAQNIPQQLDHFASKSSEEIKENSEQEFTQQSDRPHILKHENFLRGKFLQNLSKASKKLEKGSSQNQPQHHLVRSQKSETSLFSLEDSQSDWGIQKIKSSFYAKAAGKGDWIKQMDSESEQVQGQQQKKQTRSIFLETTNLSFKTCCNRTNFKAGKISKSQFIQFRRTQIGKYYEFHKLIGQGSFGSVFNGAHIKTNVPCAIKSLKKVKNEVFSPSQMKQLQILKKLDHPNIIKLYDLIVQKEQLYIVTELCSGGSLKDLVTKLDHDQSLSIDVIKQVFRQILYALSHLHQQNIIHRDIKLENVMLVEQVSAENIGNLRLKVIDFGLATYSKFKTNNKDSPFIGSPNYWAPEVSLGKYSHKCDIWSLGVIVHCLLHKKFPFALPDFKQISDLKSKMTFTPREQHWKAIPSDLILLLEKMFTFDSSKRPNALMCLQSGFFGQQQQASTRTEKQLVQKMVTNTTTLRCSNSLLSFIQSFLSYQSKKQGQIQRLQRFFQKADLNNNGLIELQELQKIVSVYTNEEDSFNVAFRQNRWLLEKIDKDNSGNISLSEFITVFTGNGSQLFTRQNLVRVFEFFDVRSKGFINFQDLKKQLKECHEDQLREIVGLMNPRIPDQILMAEFIDYVMREKFEQGLN